MAKLFLEPASKGADALEAAAHFLAVKSAAESAKSGNYLDLHFPSYPAARSALQSASAMPAGAAHS